MAEEHTIAEAYVQIKPSMRGVSDNIATELGDAGSKSSSSFGAAFTDGIKKIGAVTAAAVGAAAAGVTALAKTAVSNFADYEQLVGGVETLFGDSADVVAKNASQAFETAGMSANDYMETVTSFSASLLQSLEGDTEAAANAADVAIQDMSDNANKMGTSMESIQNAYQGFAKQNYTMLDNLKLGYGGTKSEMERLLADAEELSGVEYNIESLSDVYEAIHVIQTEMGITGTTALEASTTISGSLSMVGAAWQNLLTGIADENADLGALIDDLVESAKTAAGNLMPVIQQALAGIASFVGEMGPIIAEALPVLIESLVPTLLESAVTLVNAFANALPDLMQSIIALLPQLLNLIVNNILSLLPMIISVGLDLILALADGIIEALPTLIPAVIDIILAIVDKLTQPDTLISLIEAAIQIILALTQGLIDALPQLIERLPEIVMNIVAALVEAAPMLAEAAWQMILMICKGIAESLPILLESATQIIFTIIEGIVQMLGNLVMKGKEIGDAIDSGFSGTIEAAKTWGKDLIDNFINGIKEKWEHLKETVSNVANTVKDFLGFSEPDEGPLSNFHTYAPDMMDLFAKGIRENVGTVKSAMNYLAGEVSSDITTTASVVGTTTNLARGVEERQETKSSSGYTQNLYITSPKALSPSEVARQTRNANRQMILALKGV